MKKIAALILFFSTTFLMGMKKNNPDDVSLKLNTLYEKKWKTCKSLLSFESPIRDLLFLAGLKAICLNEIYRKVENIGSSEDVNIGSSTCETKVFGKAIHTSFDFISRNPINKKDFESIDASLKFISNQSNLIYEELRKKKEEYYSVKKLKLNSSSVLYRHPKVIALAGFFVCARVSNLAAGYLSSKIFDKSDMPKRNFLVRFSSGLAGVLLWNKLNTCLYGSGVKKTQKTFLKQGLGLTFGSLFLGKVFNKSSLAHTVIKSGICSFGMDVLFKLTDKPFSSYYKNCKAFKEKEVYEKNKKQFHALEVQALDLSRWAKTRKAYILKSLFKKGIREKENNKISDIKSLLDVAIRTPYWSKSARDKR